MKTLRVILPSGNKTTGPIPAPSAQAILKQFGAPIGDMVIHLIRLHQLHAKLSLQHGKVFKALDRRLRRLEKARKK